ncbi:hypothetical protein [Campylobacter hyointestinalis]|uniref:hypothetical protein n=1 Tax=Campylobacter hyointestinalis TaxID=198 RepID=UPI0015EEC83D|nr:hypothetical protein [Campylobacter hyointestinalis]
MDRLTNKERNDLEAVFAVIYRDNNSKFMSFYKQFYRDFYKKIKLFKFKNISKKR